MEKLEKLLHELQLSSTCGEAGHFSSGCRKCLSLYQRNLDVAQTTLEVAENIVRTEDEAGSTLLAGIRAEQMKMGHAMIAALEAAGILEPGDNHVAFGQGAIDAMQAEIDARRRAGR